MKLIYTVLSILFAITYYGCTNTNCSTFDLDTYYLQENTDYRFTMLTQENVPVADIMVSVTTRDRYNINGNNSIIIAYTDTVVSLSSIKRAFSAKEEEDDNRVLLNTNPKIADGNIFFDFRLDKNRVEGQWYYSSMKGKKASGKLTGYKSTFNR